MVLMGWNNTSYSFRGVVMPESEWGLCKDCKWWQIEPRAAIEDLTLGLCIDEELQPFLLRVMSAQATRTDKPIKPQVVAHELGKRLLANAIVACDSGTVATWWARHI